MWHELSLLLHGSLRNWRVHHAGMGLSSLGQSWTHGYTQWGQKYHRLVWFGPTKSAYYFLKKWYYSMLARLHWNWPSHVPVVGVFIGRTFLEGRTSSFGYVKKNRINRQVISESIIWKFTNEITEVLMQIINQMIEFIHKDAMFESWKLIHLHNI